MRHGPQLAAVTRAALLACTALVLPARAFAADGSWTGANIGAAWETTGNWSPAALPTNTATFDPALLTGAAVTSLTLENSQTLDRLLFATGATPYTISLIAGPGGSFRILTLNGAGITNNSSAMQTIVLNGANGNDYAGLFLNNTAALGNVTITTPGGSTGLLRLFDSSSAGPATLNNVIVQMFGNSTLGTATLTSIPQLTSFTGTGVSLGSATISIASGGQARLATNASLGTADITIGGGGAFMQVFDTVDGSTATVRLQAGSQFLQGNGGTAMAAFTLGTLVATGGTLSIGNAGSTMTINRIGGGGAMPLDITGAGNLILAGSEARTLTGTSSLTGTITLQGGSLTVGNGGTTGSIAGGVALGAGTTLGFNRSNTVTHAGVISGAGGVTQNGSGLVTLTQNNTYTGPTTINAGRLALSGTAQLPSSPVTVNSGGAFDISFHTSASPAVIGGLAGAGNVFLGANTLQVAGGSGTFSGVIADGGLDGGTRGQLVLGNGATLTLSGANTFTGATTINSGGTLVVNGSMPGAVAVQQGGTLGGNGTIGTTTNAGRIAPGNSVGTLNVAGNLTMAPTGTLAMEVQGSTADRINVSGTAALGGTLQLIPVGTSFGFNTPLVLVNAGTVTGNFANVTSGSFGAAVNPVVAVTGTQVLLTLTPQDIAPATSGGGNEGWNLRVTAEALDAARAGGGNMNPFFGVLNAPASLSRIAVNQLTGEIGTAVKGMGAQAGTQFLWAMLDPGAAGRAPLPGDGADLGHSGQRYTVWGAALGSYGRVGGNPTDGSANRQERSVGVAAGVDVRLDADAMVGVALAGGQAAATLDGGLGRANADVAQLGTYGQWRRGALTLGAAGAYARMDMETERTISFLGATPAKADYVAHVLSGRVEARYDLPPVAGITVSPVLAMQGQQVQTPGYAETIGGASTGAALRVRSGTGGTARTELGLAADTGLGSAGGVALRATGRLAWAHYVARDNDMTASFSGLPGPSFTTRGARPDGNSALAGAGLEAQLAEGLTLAARMEGEFSGNVSSLGGTARLRYAF